MKSELTSIQSSTAQSCSRRFGWLPVSNHRHRIRPMCAGSRRLRRSRPFFMEAASELLPKREVCNPRGCTEARAVSDVRALAYTDARSGTVSLAMETFRPRALINTVCISCALARDLPNVRTLLRTCSIARVQSSALHPSHVRRCATSQTFASFLHGGRK